MIIEHQQIVNKVETAIESTNELAWDYPLEFDTKKGVVLFDGPQDIGTKKGDKISQEQAVEYALWFALVVDNIKKHAGKALKLAKKSKMNEAAVEIGKARDEESLLGESEIWSSVFAEISKISH